MNFAELSTEMKWQYISSTMDNIAALDRVHEMRRRLNPHHPKADQRVEAGSVRREQLAKWTHIKDLYVEHRDELVNTCNSDAFMHNKSILERILTKEFDDELQKVFKNNS